MDYFLDYFSPSMGVLMATLMFAAPIQDLRTALKAGSLKSLNPFPWPFMTGNCWGWVVYGQYTSDPFVLAANVPGLILSLWLCLGAAKLQYFERQSQQLLLLRQSEQQRWNDASPALGDGDDNAAFSAAGQSSTSNLRYLPLDIPHDDPRSDVMFVPVERSLLRIVILWATVLIAMEWMGGSNWLSPTLVVGWLVNANLVVFYSAPLQSLQTVIRTKQSSSIHRPTLYMNYVNTSFWILYGGFVRVDPMIYVPNGVGLMLGIIQGILCLYYPPHPPLSPNGRLVLGDDRQVEDEDAGSTQHPIVASEE